MPPGSIEICTLIRIACLAENHLGSANEDAEKLRAAIGKSTALIDAPCWVYVVVAYAMVRAVL